MKRSIYIFLSLLLLSGSTLGQSGGQFEIRKSVIGSGISAAMGGTFRLDATAGEPAAGVTSTGGLFALASGFWGGGDIVEEPTPTPTPSPVPTATPTPTPEPSPIATPTPTPTPEPSPIATPTPTPTPEPSPIATPTPTPTPEPTPSPTPGGGLEGDLASRPNGDGFLLSNDVTLARQFVVGLLIPTPGSNEFQRADAAPLATLGDGILTAGDVTQVRRYVAGIDAANPAGGPIGVARPGYFAGSVFEDIYSYLFDREIGVDTGQGERVQLQDRKQQ